MADGTRHGLDYLVAAQNADGGWGYRATGMSFAEPTALALDALARLGDPQSEPAAAALARGADWLLGGQHGDGGWGVCALDEQSTWATSYAILALSRLAKAPLTTAPDTAGAVERGLGWLLRGLGPCLDVDKQVVPAQKGADPTLIGWPWLPGECFWVFPTALAMIAAVAAGRQEAPRLREGTAYLVDRVCQDGGWNAGNPYMLDQALWPKTIETAAALIALRAADDQSIAVHDVVEISLRRLGTLLAVAHSPLNIAWGLLALAAFGRTHEDAAARLATEQAPDGGWRGNPFTTALATLALSGSSLIQ